MYEKEVTITWHRYPEIKPPKMYAGHYENYLVTLMDRENNYPSIWVTTRWWSNGRFLKLQGRTVLSWAELPERWAGRRELDEDFGVRPEVMEVVERQLADIRRRDNEWAE